MRRWASSESRRLLLSRAARNLQQPWSAESFSTSSAAAQPTAAKSSLKITVSLTESIGRGVFATQRIGAGELIHTAKPLVTHPSLALSDRVCCYHCLRRLNSDASSRSFSLLRGENGSSYWFCSEECRDESKGFYEIDSKADWSLYHDHCRTQGLKYPLMVKRFACMVISGIASADGLEILQPAILLPGVVTQVNRSSLRVTQ